MLRVEGFEENEIVERFEQIRLSGGASAHGVLEITLLASLPLGVLQALLVTADGNEAGLLLERVADGAGADLSVLQVATKVEAQIEMENRD